MNNKWIRAAIPALLIHISVGTVYCWSTFKEIIAAQIEMSPFAVGWAFSFAIFFLGMSAAFAGKFVEKDIHKSSLISCICFSVGMIGTGLSIFFLKGWLALIGIYICYGAIMGVGLGIGYLTPVKTLMLWFSKNKGLATGISIMGFGLAKAIATPIMELLQNKFGIVPMFIILGCFYFIIMFIGHLLLKKPEGWVEEIPKEKTNILSMFKQREFVGIWLMFYINIHCGLMIISYEKQILNVAFASAAILASIVSIVPSCTAISNALGRIGYSSFSDKLSQRNSIYKIIFISCIAISLYMLFTNAINGATTLILTILVIVYLLIINAGYGGGFSTLPALLSERFGMKKISQIHGLALSAWAVAGLTGNNTSEILLNTTGSYQVVIAVATTLYAVALLICIFLVQNKKKEIIE
jgi:OFA family oxalate/formate antiporter-like MFS transporter